MIKTIEDVKARLNELMTAKAEKESNLNKELADAKRKAKLLEAALKTTADITKYRELVKEKKENEDYLSFLQSRQNSMNNKRSNFESGITQEEYWSNNKVIESEIDTLQTDYAPRVESKVNELVAILAEYEQKALELEALRDNNSRLLNGRPFSRSSVSDLAQKCTGDKLFYSYHICLTYFAQSAVVARLKSAISQHLTNPCCNSEEAQIYGELIKSDSK